MKPPPPRSPTASSGRSTACCPRRARCRSPRSSTASPACSSGRTSPTRRWSAPASTAIAASPSTQDNLVTTDDLNRRSREHGELIAEIVELGHRLGFSCWIGARQQRRKAGGIPLWERLDDRELAGPPYFGRIRGEDFEDVDVIWYVRGRAAFLWEVEWTAMLGDTVHRHARMPPDERLVRFLVVLPERAELVRHKLERSPLLRTELQDGDWHLIKANHLRDWVSHEEVALADMEGLLGLDPAVERTGDQLALFGG